MSLILKVLAGFVIVGGLLVFSGHVGGNKGPDDRPAVCAEFKLCDRNNMCGNCTALPFCPQAVCVEPKVACVLVCGKPECRMTKSIPAQVSCN